MAELPNVLLNLTNRAENVLLVREMLSGVAEAVDLDANDLNDIRTAVTEACNNVVLHAYEGEEGPLEVEVHLRPHMLLVVVRDRGGGLGEYAAAASGKGAGIGLTVIEALTHRFELTPAGDGGTEVRMEFLAPRIRPLSEQVADGPWLHAMARGDRSNTTMVSVAHLDLARTVLPRLLSALAVRAHFSTDRIADMQLVSDALVAHAPGSIDGSHLSVAVSVEPRNLELSIGPLGMGNATRLMNHSDLEGLGGVIEKLTDSHRVAIDGTHEVLTLELAGRR